MRRATGSLRALAPTVAAAVTAACLGGTEPILVAAVVVSPDSVVLTAIGQTQRFTAAVIDADGDTVQGAPVAWSTWDTAIVELGAGGLATAAGPGTTLVFAEAGRVLGRAWVAVIPRVETVEVDPHDLTLALGDSAQLSAVPRDANGHVVSGIPVVWSSADTGVARVDASGIVHGVGGGATSVSATVGQGTGTVSVTVPWPAWLDLAWSAVDLRQYTGSDVIAVAALDSGRIVVGTASGSRVLERMSGAWSARTVPCTNNAIGDFWVESRSERVFAVGRGYWERCILERTATQWRRHDGDSVFNLNAVSGVDTAQIYVAGTWGLLQRGDARWLLVEYEDPAIPSLPWYEDVLALSSVDVWAVGRAGLVVRFDGSEWRRVPFPDDRDVRSVWRAAGAVWADNARWSGATWTESGRLPRGVTDAATLPSVASYVASADTLFASADGARWWAMPGAPPTRRLWVTGEGVVLALTGEDAVLHVGRPR